MNVLLHDPGTKSLAPILWGIDSRQHVDNAHKQVEDRDSGREKDDWYPQMITADRLSHGQMWGTFVGPSKIVVDYTDGGWGPKTTCLETFKPAVILLVRTKVSKCKNSSSFNKLK